jgi:hypothetical protein
MFWIQNYGLNEAYRQLLVTLILFQYAVLICYTFMFMSASLCIQLSLLTAVHLVAAKYLNNKTFFSKVNLKDLSSYVLTIL